MIEYMVYNMAKEHVNDPCHFATWLNTQGKENWVLCELKAVKGLGDWYYMVVLFRRSSSENKQETRMDDNVIPDTPKAIPIRKVPYHDLPLLRCPSCGGQYRTPDPYTYRVCGACDLSARHEDPSEF